MSDPRSQPQTPQLPRHAIYRISLASLVLLVIVATYWPIRHADFVWDDLTAFVENDWLVEGEQWRHYVLRDFHGWINYFRPLGVLLFTAQARLFDSQSGPMHLVSLALHLVGTSLVGAIVAHCTRMVTMDGRKRLAWVGACMALYGLHPASTESVAWISSQFELLLVICSLSAIWAAVTMRPGWARALVLGGAFFLAACSKETAIILPVLVLLIDWMMFCLHHTSLDAPTARRRFFRRNASAAAAMLAGGLAYLVCREFGLGHLLVQTSMYGGELTPLGTAQKIAWTWWRYLELLAAPAKGLDVVHSFETEDFETLRPGLLVLAAVSVAGLSWAAQAAIRRGAPFACLMLAFFIALLPTLNILPAGYAISLYHDRYLMLALAMCCVILPMIKWPRLKPLPPRTATALLGVIAITWLAVSVATIRVTLPSWKEDTSLWRSAILRNQTNEVVQYNLTAALLRHGQVTEAARYANEFAAARTACTLCDIEIASASLDQGEVGQATTLIERASDSAPVRTDLDVRAKYYRVAGELALNNGRAREALVYLKLSSSLEPGDPVVHVLIAETFASLGEFSKARHAADNALEASPKSKRQAISTWHDSFIGRAPR